ncbi:hypothetical protein GOV14_04110 [Candidatus Pacearchaeota archaeon]|nr:hypothetical protein [Candidatus Pacearchaeota archaeon]
MDLQETIKDNLKKVFSSRDSFFATLIGVIMFILVIKPMFQVSIFSGILLILTFLYILLIKTEIIIESPGYAVVLFAIFAIRFHIVPIFFDGLKNMKSGLWINGITFMIVWLMIYLKTKELENET